MTYLVARIDHALTRGINWLTTCLVERARGFDSSEAGDFLEYAEALAEREAEQEVAEPRIPCELHHPEPGCTECDVVYDSACDLWTCKHCHGVASLEDTMCTLAKTPTAGQRGESPVGDDSPTSSIGSPEHHCDCGLSDDMADLDAHAAVCTIWDEPTCYFCGNPTANVVNTDCDGDTEFVCEKCAADEIGAHPVPTDPSPAGECPDHHLVTGNTPTPVRSANPVESGAGVGLPAWVDWAVPAICDVLTEHQCHGCRCGCGQSLWGNDTWRAHVAPLIAERLDTAAQDARPTQK